jgi:uncharacterized membrane protein HdeD (DUF308 family)
VNDLLDRISSNWWLFLVRGIVAIVLAILTYMWPGIAIGILVSLFGAYAAIDGLLALGFAIRCAARRERWLGLLFEGVLGVLVGAVVFALPGAAALSFAFLVAAWAISTGVFEIVAAVRLRKQIEGEFWLALAGVISIVIGVWFLARPGLGLLATVWALASYELLFGFVLIGLAFRLRGVRSPRLTLAQKP